MGQVREVWEKHRYLDLTREDIRKQEERRLRRQNREIHPRVFEWHKRFAARLAKCPVCGRTPFMCCIWNEYKGYDYKFCCDFHKYTSPNGQIYDMGCGDWYESLSRAGLSWNYMVQAALTGEEEKSVRHVPLTEIERIERSQRMSMLQRAKRREQA